MKCEKFTKTVTKTVTEEQEMVRLDMTMDEAKRLALVLGHNNSFRSDDAARTGDILNTLIDAVGYPPSGFKVDTLGGQSFYITRR